MENRNKLNWPRCSSKTDKWRIEFGALTKVGLLANTDRAVQPRDLYSEKSKKKTLLERYAYENRIYLLCDIRAFGTGELCSMWESKNLLPHYTFLESILVEGKARNKHSPVKERKSRNILAGNLERIMNTGGSVG